MKPLSKTTAGKFEMLNSLYQQPVYDEETGEFLRYELTGFITKEEYLQLLNSVND